MEKAGSVAYVIVLKGEKTAGRLFVAVFFVDSKAENRKEENFRGRKFAVPPSMIKGNEQSICREGKGDRGRRIDTSMPDTVYSN